jgi:peptidoglycan/xylan/chitin deacetylase (PgdA/CDA1 family)
MELLRQFGYTAIPMSLLVDAIVKGADLPARPVVLTFDDGNKDIYKYAFPILQEMGYMATVYLVGDYVGKGSGMMSLNEVQELLAAGWEVGSHSMSHKVKRSRQILEEELGAPVLTFAYPYAAEDAAVMDWAREGYRAAVGVGESSDHSLDALYYLSRFDVRSTVDLKLFASFLPWRDEGW